MTAATDNNSPGPRRMDVLFLSRKWPPAVGGMETYSFELVQQMKTRVNLTCCVLPGRPDGSVPGAIALLCFAVRAVWVSLRQPRKCDVIHAADMAIWPLAFAARIRSPNAAVVLSAHGTDVSFPDRRGVGPALYGLYMRIGSALLPNARVLANSHATAERARKLGFKPPEVIPLATRRFTDSSMPVAPEGFVLFAGRVIKRKGLSWFVHEVLPHLPSKIRLRVAGPILDEKEGAVVSFDRVSHLGTLDQTKLSDLMGRAICVVVPNIPAGPGHYEGFGLVAVEAAGAGAVVVAPRMDGFTDSVIDGVTGFLVEPMDSAGWVLKISEIASWNPRERSAFLKGSTAMVRSHFTWERVAVQTIVAYESVLG